MLFNSLLEAGLIK